MSIIDETAFNLINSSKCDKPVFARIEITFKPFVTSSVYQTLSKVWCKGEVQLEGVGQSDHTDHDRHFLTGSARETNQRHAPLSGIPGGNDAVCQTPWQMTA